MSDEKQNVDSLLRRATSANSITAFDTTSSARFPSASPFCHSCHTNQTLILSIMANAEDTDEMNEEEIQNWQLSLQSRYPPVCDQCQEMVNDRIERADKTARRLIWNSWLSKSRGKTGMSPRAGRHAVDTTETVNATTSADSMSSKAGLFWILQCLAFLANCAVALSIPWRKANLASSEQTVYFAALLVTQMISYDWDPTFPNQLQIRKRTSPTSSINVKGKDGFRLIQRWLFVVQFLQLFLPSLSVSHPRISSTLLSNPASTLCIATQVILLCKGLYGLEIVEPRPISLKSRTPSKSQGKPKANVASSAELTFLSLDSQCPTTSYHTGNKEEERSLPVERQDGEEMDWSPTALADSSTNFYGDSFQLGPQRYFEPLRKTELEDMLDKQLTLEEKREARWDKARKRTIHTGLLAWWTVASASLLFSLIAVTLGPKQLRIALSQLVAHWQHGFDGYLVNAGDSNNE
jgi:hypothetical protein